MTRTQFLPLYLRLPWSAGRKWIAVISPFSLCTISTAVRKLPRVKRREIVLSLLQNHYPGVLSEGAVDYDLLPHTGGTQIVASVTQSAGLKAGSSPFGVLRRAVAVRSHQLLLDLPAASRQNRSMVIVARGWIETVLLHNRTIAATHAITRSKDLIADLSRALSELRRLHTSQNAALAATRVYLSGEDRETLSGWRLQFEQPVTLHLFTELTRRYRPRHRLGFLGENARARPRLLFVWLAASAALIVDGNAAITERAELRQELSRRELAHEQAALVNTQLLSREAPPGRTPVSVLRAVTRCECIKLISLRTLTLTRSGFEMTGSAALPGEVVRRLRAELPAYTISFQRLSRSAPEAAATFVLYGKINETM